MTDTAPATVEVVEGDDEVMIGQVIESIDLITEEEAAEQGLFDGVHEPTVITVVEDGIEKRKVRQRKPYHVAIQRPQTLKEAIANERSSGVDLFSDILDDMVSTKPRLDEMYGTVADLNRVKGTNGLNAISLFSGCAGSGTGFALAGWNELMAVEFVKSARETIAANYPSTMIEPREVTDHVKNWLEANPDHGIEVSMTKPRKIRGSAIPSVVNWEETLEAAAKVAADTGDASQFETVKRMRHDVSLAILKEKHSKGNIDLWGDDIRGLDPTAILEATGLKRGELDCLEGSPPCKSFSMSGIREDGWGQVLHYSDERDQRTDDLFIEYVRILTALMPKTFIAENVQGLTVGAAAQDVMRPLLKEFDKLGYRVQAQVLNSSDYGVAQTRPRVFFVGVRKDLINKKDGSLSQFSFPKRNPHSYTLGDVLETTLGKSPEAEMNFAIAKPEHEVAKIWHSLSIGAAPETKAYQLMRCHPDLPTPTITATSANNTPAAGPMHPTECRKFTITEYRYLFGFPTDYVFTGDYAQQGEHMGRSVTPYLMKQIAEQIAKVIHESEPSGEEF